MEAWLNQDYRWDREQVENYLRVLQNQYEHAHDYNRHGALCRYWNYNDWLMICMHIRRLWRRRVDNVGEVVRRNFQVNNPDRQALINQCHGVWNYMLTYRYPSVYDRDLIPIEGSAEWMLDNIDDAGWTRNEMLACLRRIKKEYEDARQYLDHGYDNEYYDVAIYRSMKMRIDNKFERNRDRLIEKIRHSPALINELTYELNIWHPQLNQ